MLRNSINSKPLAFWRGAQAYKDGKNRHQHPYIQKASIRNWLSGWDSEFQKEFKDEIRGIKKFMRWLEKEPMVDLCNQSEYSSDHYPSYGRVDALINKCLQERKAYGDPER